MPIIVNTATPPPASGGVVFGPITLGPAPTAPPPAAARPTPLDPEAAAKLALDTFTASTPPEFLGVEVQPPLGAIVTSDTIRMLIRRAAQTHTPAMDVSALSVELVWPGGGGTPSRFLITGVRKRGA